MIIDLIEQNIADISLSLLERLLADKTTGRSIIWATDNYAKYGEEYEASREIIPELIIGCNTHIIQPRVSKALVEQTQRTRDRAEVFTPSWVCNEQNNLVDEAWFGRKNIFNYSQDHEWKVTQKPVSFPAGKSWQDYVDARRLEVSCGEAPYIVSRYDTVSGKSIALNERIGLLDRKMRVVNENAEGADEWKKWARRAFESVYGYEYQGDNVLLARENLLLSYIEYYTQRFDRKPTLSEAQKIATVISWNIWQMDGMTFLPPNCEEDSPYEQMTITSFSESPRNVSVPCVTYDWRSHCRVEFRSLMNGGRNHG